MTLSLTRMYFLAFVIMLLIFVLGYFYVSSLYSAAADSERIINLAGRQRMLSQRIVQYALRLQLEARDTATTPLYNAALYDDAIELGRIHSELIAEQGELSIAEMGVLPVLTMLEQLSPQVEQLTIAVQCLVDSQNNDCSGSADDYLGQILAPEQNFAETMDLVVLELQQTISARRARAEQASLILFIIELTGFFVIGLFVVRPMVMKSALALENLKHAKMQLEESESTLRHLFGASPIGTIISDPVTNTVHVNEAMHRFLGYDDGELYDVPAQDLNGKISFADDLPLEQALITHVQNRQQTHFRLEKRFVKKDGSLIWGNQTSFMLKDAQGQILKSVMHVIDISKRREAEDALKRSEANLRAVLDSSSMSYMLIDLEYKIIDIDRVGRRNSRQIFGKEARRDDSVFDFVQDHDIDAFETNFRRALNGESVFVQKVFHDEQAQVRAYEIQYFPVRTADAKIIGVCMSSLEVTERYKTYESLQNSEMRFRTLVEDAPVGIYQTDAQGQFTFVNKAWSAMTGIPEYEARDDDWQGTLHPEDQLRVITGWRTAVTGGGGFFDEYRVLPDSSRVIWVESRAEPVKDSRGRVIEYLGTLIDITARKNVEMIQYNMLRTLELYIAASNDGFWDWQLEKSDLYISPRWKQMLGYQVNELPNQIETIEQLLWEGDEFSIQELVAQFSNTDATDYSRTLRFMHHENYPVSVLMRIALLRDETGRVTRMVAAHTDITEWVRMKEAADAANRAKSRFLAHMSHELRTPLNAILGFSQLMEQDEALTEANQQYLRIIGQSGNNLLEMINEVLELSRIEAGASEVHERVFDLQQLLIDVQRLLQVRAKARGLDLLLEIDPDLPRHIRMDQGKLRQIFTNLIGNSIKFTEAGSIIVRANQQDDRLVFEIKDTGVGIEEEAIDTLFQMFSQSNSGRQSSEGAGLGLAISREFARLLGGDLTLTSTLGKGTVVKFWLPLKEANGTEAIHDLQTRRIIGLEPDQPVYRVLVVDDQPENRQMIAELLNFLQLEVRVAEGGLEAVDCVRQWEPHLILMDVRMPDVDGFEATKRIREMDLLSVRPIIIAVTASVLEHQREEILKAGCDDFIAKPFVTDALYETLADSLGLKFIYSNIRQHDVSGALLKKKISDILPLLSQVDDNELLALNRAVMELNTEGATLLIRRIGVIDHLLEQTLLELVENYRFDLIRDAIEQIRATP